MRILVYDTYTQIICYYTGGVSLSFATHNGLYGILSQYDIEEFYLMFLDDIYDIKE